MKDNKSVKKALDRVSTSFCLAKWLQVTIDLYNGKTHSCYHPPRHHIPLDELKNNSGALHNTKHKKEQRKKMLSSVRPEECSYCWEVEDATSDSYSERVYKSASPWAIEKFDHVLSQKWDDNIDPTYVEVMFSNTCNLSCAYCGADVSSSIEKEVEKWGKGHLMSQLLRANGPASLSLQERSAYVNAFWDWFPKIKDGLHHLRVTGGEPFLDSNTFKLIEELKKTKNPKLIFGVNSNFSLPYTSMKKSFSSIVELEKVLKGVEVYVSLDSIGEKAEYIRYGLDLKLLHQNLKLFRSYSSKAKIVIMCTFSIFSMDDYRGFLKYVLELKKELGNVYLNIIHIQQPEFLGPHIATSGLRDFLAKDVEFMKQRFDSSGECGFSDQEIKKLERIRNLIAKPLSEDSYIERVLNFYLMVEEYDKRKGLCFEKTFSNLIPLKRMGEKFWSLAKDCKDLS